MEQEPIEYPPYLILSAVGNYMGYILPEFIEACRSQVPKPAKIVLCLHADHPFNLSEIEAEDIYIEINPEMFVPDKIPPRIETSMEILRLHFIHNPLGIEYALWIDTDVIIPSNTFAALYKASVESDSLITTNKVQGRESKNKFCGPALMLTYFDACTLSKFFRGMYRNPEGYIQSNDGVMWSTFSEDYVFFAVFDQCSGSLPTGRTRGRICEEFVEVDHRWIDLKNRERKKPTYQMPSPQHY